MKKTQFLQANGLKALRSRTNVQASTPRQIENKKHLQSQASTGKGILRKNQIDFSQNSIIVRGLSWVSGESNFLSYFNLYFSLHEGYRGSEELFREVWRYKTTAHAICE